MADLVAVVRDGLAEGRHDERRWQLRVVRGTRGSAGAADTQRLGRCCADLGVRVRKGHGSGLLKAGVLGCWPVRLWQREGAGRARRRRGGEAHARSRGWADSGRAKEASTFTFLSVSATPEKHSQEREGGSRLGRAMQLRPRPVKAWPKRAESSGTKGL